MALSTSANEGSYVQAISNRWDNALVGNLEAYTPSANLFPEPKTMYLTAAANVTFVPWESNKPAITVGFPAGWVPVRVKQITAISAGSVYIGW